MQNHLTFILCQKKNKIVPALRNSQTPGKIPREISNVRVREGTYMLRVVRNSTSKPHLIQPEGNPRAPRSLQKKGWCFNPAKN